MFHPAMYEDKDMRYFDQFTQPPQYVKHDMGFPVRKRSVITQPNTKVLRTS